jgi:F0F1-type ATP synthase assembly protein I
MGDEPQPPKQENPWVTMAKYSHLAFALPASTFAGWLIGAALDRWLGTTSLHIAGIVIGMVAGFVEVGRIIVKQAREK